MQEENEFCRNKFANRLRIVADMFFEGKTGRLAEHFGMSPQTFSKYLGGKRTLGGEKLSLLTQLGVSVEWVLTGKGHPLNPDILKPDAQWKRLYIVRLRTTVFHGTTRIAAEALDVDIDTYIEWETGKKTIPEYIVDEIFIKIGGFVNEEWWYEGKGKMFKEASESGTLIVQENNLNYLSIDKEKVENDICNFLNEMIRQDSREDREAFARTIKIKLREVGLFTQKD